MAPAPKVLVIDDEELNLELLRIHLRNSGYQVLAADDGDTGLEMLKDNPDVEVIVLDRMMPRMDGLEVLRALKCDTLYREIPVIMQTAAASTQEIEEGINAGAFYYLPKPYDEGLLLSLVRTALIDYKSQRTIREEVRKRWSAVGLMNRGAFRFRTLEDASNICYLVANCFPNPSQIVYGLNELMVNAIEHGNLGITYDERKILLNSGKRQAEIERRLALPEHKEKYATLEFEVTDEAYIVTITDQGSGFDWQEYINFSPERAVDPNGRGIAFALRKSFSSLEYKGMGNKVVCKLLRNDPPKTWSFEQPKFNYSTVQSGVIQFV